MALTPAGECTGVWPGPRRYRNLRDLSVPLRSVTSSRTPSPRPAPPYLWSRTPAITVCRHDICVSYTCDQQQLSSLFRTLLAHRRCSEPNTRDTPRQRCGWRHHGPRYSVPASVLEHPTRRWCSRQSAGRPCCRQPRPAHPGRSDTPRATTSP